ncbi:ABC transporter permease [Actinocorallia sp. A-T 12471]|uniref:ABC transporter permease n=1 Tax=Actinocorallia sp. A-T 12471 TaxID=3089813 RepID=UPI0029CB0A7F|nr:ABC transporter permease [Actinocorallia sp. A-T 12471]MDX6740215.1 ABC transporter permease [Actinocorallia sp. A-T 12471]
MTRFLVRRIAVSAPLLVMVSFLTFVLVSLTPGDAAYTVLGAGATSEQLAQLRDQMGLDRPLLSQYTTWLGHALSGDFGASLISGQPVGHAIGQQLASTLSLVLLSVLVSTFFGVMIGAWSAARGGRLARLVDSLSFAALAVPGFLLGLLLILVFVLAVPVLPASGYVPLLESPSGWLRSLVLPVAALSFGGIGIIAKQSRAAMEDVLGSEFVVVLRANGFRRGSIIYRHGLKAAAVRIQSVVGVMFVGLLSGSVLIESIFALPGLGSLAVQASAQGDLPLILGVTVVFTLLVVAANLILDNLFLLVNPKVVHR